MNMKHVVRTLVALAIPLTLSCAGASPSAPAPTLVLTSSQILVGGVSVGGQTLPVGHGGGAMTRFEARLHDGTGTVMSDTVRVRYQRPGGMMHGAGEFRLYDDGTHGDHVAGDGLYCLDDVDGSYGCNAHGVTAGQYRYEFCGYGAGGQSSNTQTVVVTLQ